MNQDATPLLDPRGLRSEAAALWPGGAPGARGQELLDQPLLTIHPAPAEQANGAAVIVNPGGGYRILASDHEGLQVARWLGSIGITAFVLRYRVAPTYHSSISLLDGLRAVRHVRANAARYGVSTHRIGMLGFSAGGHLAAAVGTAWDDGDPSAADPVERVSSRPDFIVPVYAVTNGAKRGRKADEYSPTDEHVTAETPPAFIVHTHLDATVPATQATLFYDALFAAGVPAELHVFNLGEHGLGLMAGDPDLHHWTGLLQRWLRRRGFLTEEKRTGVRGRLTLNGEPMGIAWVTLVPDAATAPLARVRINRETGGEFEISAEDGPVPGRHTLEVRHSSAQYPHVATGIYTLGTERVHRRRVDIVENAVLDLALTGADFES